MIKIEKIKIENFGSIDKKEITFDRIVLLHNEGDKTMIYDLMLIIKFFLNINPNYILERDFDSIIDEYNERFFDNTKIEITFTFQDHYFVYRQNKNEVSVTDYISGFRMCGSLRFYILDYIFNPNILSYGYISSLCDNYCLEDYSNELNSTLSKLKNKQQIYGTDLALIFNEKRYNTVYTDILEEFSYFNPLVLDDNLRIFLSDNGVKLMDNSGNKINEKDLDDTQLNTFDLGCFLILNKLLDNIMSMEDKDLINSPLIISHSIDNLSTTALENTLKSSLVEGRQIFLEQNTDTMHKLQSLDLTPSTFITEVNEKLKVSRRIK